MKIHPNSRHFLLNAVVFLFLSLFFSHLFIPAALAAPETSMPKSLTILGKQVVLKDCQGGGPGQKFIAEYIPENENWDNWTSMFASRYVPGNGQKLDALASAEATAARITERKKNGDIMANSAVFKAPDGKSVVVDFLISEGKIIEHNIFRYFPSANGLVSLQIARRVYDDKANDAEVKAFIESIKTQRKTLLEETMRADLPVCAAAR